MKIEGKNGISATIVLDSISPESNRLITMEIEYPRLILAELNTHRMLSKNSASSRAIPFEKMKQNLTGEPVRFGAANKGMQDTGENHISQIIVPSYEPAMVDGYYNGYYEKGEDVFGYPEAAWESAKQDAIKWSIGYYNAGYHKQVYNRVTEPFQMMKTVISGTEWANFFWLRNDVAADPTLQELARCMREVYDTSMPQTLRYDEWHLPYVEVARSVVTGHQVFIDDITGLEMSLDDAIKMSCARACAVSFRNVDYGLEKSKEVYARLVGDSKIHGSALEHAAKVMSKPNFNIGTLMTSKDFINLSRDSSSWENGVSHADRQRNLWSGNFKGYIQHRKTIKGENHVDD